MNPTEEQLKARLNPTPTQVQYATDGIFRGKGDIGNIYKRTGNTISSFDITNLLDPSTKSSLGNYGNQTGNAYQILKDKYGLDFNSLGESNLGDMFSADQTLQRGSPNSFAASSSDINQFITAKPSSFQTSTINNTPNYLSVPPSSLASAPVAKTPTTFLQTGATGQSVKDLQDYLVKSGYMTQAQVDTGYGTYGPQTTAAVEALQKKLGVDNSSGVGQFGPKTIAALGASPSSPPTSQMSNPLTTTSGGSTPAPNFPTPQGGNTADTYNQSLTAQIETLKKSIQTEADKRAKEYDVKIKEFETKMSDLQVLQNEGMAGNLRAVTEETNAKKAALDLEKQRFDENYNANQSLIGELDGLLTTGNQVIENMKNTTGLSSILDPRISKTISDVQARAGVINSILSARNGQMGQAQNQLASSVSALTSIAKDQIDYYKTLVDFYENQKGDTKEGVKTLKADQKDYLDTKITLLENDLKNTQIVADLVSKAMLDPDTALAYASAGVSLNDTPQQINAKLATYAYAKEISTTSNTMAKEGYSASPMAGATAITTTDSRGVTKNWWKPATKTSIPDVPGSLSPTDITKGLNWILNNGGTKADEEKFKTDRTFQAWVMNQF